jgi:Protein of unknown function (DUF3108)
MRHIVNICIGAILFCAAAQPAMAELPGKIQAHYDVIGFGIKLAEISETFTRTADSYQIESITRAVGFLARLKPETVRVISKGRISTQGLVPQSYSLSRDVDAHKNTSATLNWETSILSLNDYKGLRERPLPNGTQDRLSVLYHLPLVSKSAKTEFKFSITDGNSLDDYTYTLAPGETTVSVPLGTYKTRYIFSAPAGAAVKYEIWMASEHDNFPCKIIVTDAKGGKLTQVLTHLTVTP